MKTPITVPESLLIKVLALLKDSREAHENGGDRRNMVEVRRITPVITDVEHYRNLARSKT